MKKATFLFLSLVTMFAFACSKSGPQKDYRSSAQYQTMSGSGVPQCMEQHPIDTPVDIPICPADALQTMDATSFTSSEFSTGHNFQDNFLATAPIGRDYITYYYKLGKYAIDNGLLARNPTFYVQLLKRGFSVANTLMNGNPDDIVVDMDTYNYTRASLATFRANTPPADITTILNKLESDLELNKGKTRTEVITFLNTCP